MGWNINKILDSRATGLAVFAISGAAKLVSDYKTTPENKKNFVLAQDSIILGGTAVGVGIYSLLRGKVASFNACKKTGVFIRNLFNNNQLPKKNNFLNKLSFKVKKAVQTSGEIIKDCADNTSMLASGILGAIGADYGIQYTHLEKNKRLKEINYIGENTFNTIYNYENKLKGNLKNSKINRDLDNKLGNELKSNVYSRITDLPAMRMFSRTMVGVQGFEVIEEKTFKNRMKHATGCLISNSVVPLFFLSTATRLTKGLTTILRAPIIFSSLVGGTMYANKLIDNMSHGKGILHKLTTREKNNAQPILNIQIEDNSIITSNEENLTCSSE